MNTFHNSADVSLHISAIKVSIVHQLVPSFEGFFDCPQLSSSAVQVVRPNATFKSADNFVAHRLFRLPDTCFWTLLLSLTSLIIWYLRGCVEGDMLLNLFEPQNANCYTAVNFVAVDYFENLVRVYFIDFHFMFKFTNRMIVQFSSEILDNV